MAFTIKNIPRDDYGVQTLRNDNARPSVAQETKEVPPYPPVHAEESIRPVTPNRERRRKHRDRRSGHDRRDKNSHVILDTRSGRERRHSAIDRRTGKLTSADGESTPRVGIDIKI